MLENAIYSVISPESCAAIIYRDSSKAALAASALRLTAQDLLALELIDGIIPEPAERRARRIPTRPPNQSGRCFGKRLASCPVSRQAR